MRRDESALENNGPLEAATCFEGISVPEQWAENNALLQSNLVGLIGFVKIHGMTPDW